MWQVWTLYSCIALVFVGVSYGTIKLYQDKRDSTRLSTFVSSSAIFFVLLCVFTPPVDVYIVNYFPNSIHLSNSIRSIYYAQFIVLLFYSFLLVPFTYFYTKLDEIDSTKKRLWKSFKRTAFFLVLIVLLLLIGLIIALRRNTGDSSTIHWLKPLLHLQSHLELILRFVIGAVTTFGMLLWILISCRGIATVPIVGLLVRNDPDSRTERLLLHEIEHETQTSERTRNAILSKYPQFSNQVNKKDRQRLDELSKREQLLKQRQQLLTRNQTCITSSLKKCRCFFFPIGVIFVFLSFLIVVSMAMTLMDKLIYSSYKQAFILDHPSILNPIDYVLVQSSRYSPLDYILFGILMWYIIISSLAFLTRSGCGCCWIRLPSLRFKATSSSLLLLVALIMIYIALVVLFSLLTLAPQYSTFGHQTFIDLATNQTTPCHLQNTNDTQSNNQCTMSQLATFYNIFSVELPLFSLIFLAGNLVFVIFFIPFFIHSYCKSKIVDDIAYSLVEDH